MTVTVPPLLPLPDSTTQHVDDAGKPKKDLTNWLTSVQATIKSLNAAVTGVSGLLTTALLKANNLSDLTNVGTARTNLSLGNVATLNVNVANGVPQFNGSGQYPAADGQLIANIGAGLFATPSVGTTIYAQVNVNVGSFVGVSAANLGQWVGAYSFTAYGLAGSWQNVTANTAGGPYGFTMAAIFKRYA